MRAGPSSRDDWSRDLAQCSMGYSAQRPSGSGGGQRPENQLGASRRRYPRLVVCLLNYLKPWNTLENFTAK